MATSATRATAPRAGKRPERMFFCALAAMILVTVLVGFAKTYFLAGVFAAKLPSLLVHVHGLLFTSWIGLLTAQVILVSVGRVRWHMRLGVVGMYLAPLMVIVGFATLFASFRRPNGLRLLPPPVQHIIASVDILTLSLFAVLTLWAFLVRRDAAAHKRLMLLATVTIIGPAVARWPSALVHAVSWGILPVMDAFVVLLLLYDLFTLKSLHRVTVWGLLLTIAWQAAYLPFANSNLMNQIFAWVQKG